MDITTGYIIPLEPTTAATTSSDFSLQVVDQKATIIVSGLANAETAKLEIQHPISGWISYLPTGGQPTLSATVNAYTLTDFGNFRINKDATAGAVGVVVISSLRG